MQNYRNFDFISECFIDTNLVETLLEANGHTFAINHQKGCNNVSKIMIDKFKDRFAVGIIDKDKKEPTYVKQVEEICASEHLRLLKHKDRCHFLIEIHRASEDFILNCAKETNISIEKYGLTSDEDELKKITKTAKSKTDKRFRNLFRDLKNAKDMKILSNVLNYLNTRRYDSDINVLKSFFE